MKQTIKLPIPTILVSILCLALSAGCGSHSASDNTLAVGFFIGDDTIVSTQSNHIFGNYLSQQLGQDVRVFEGNSYTAVIEAMRSGRIQAMSVGPFSHCFAVEEAKAEAIAVVLTGDSDPIAYDPDQEPFYFSAIITLKGSGIQTLEDIKGRSFAFVDHVSTSGRLFPAAALMKAGLDIEKDIDTRFAGSHAYSIEAVANGTQDAGACAAYGLDRMEREGKIRISKIARKGAWRRLTQDEINQQFEEAENGEIVIIAQSAPIPRTPFAVAADMDLELKTKFRDALLALKERPELIAEIGRWYEDPTEEMGLDRLEDFYDPVRKAAKILNLDLKQLETDKN